MNLNKVDDLEYYTFSIFGNDVKHLFSTKNGGISSGKYSTLNLGIDKGDIPKNVNANYQKVCDILEFDIKKIVFAHQTHTANIYNVTEDDINPDILNPEFAANNIFKSKLSDIDGLITNVKGITLVTFHADCIPIYFYDKTTKVIALSHAGWRGTVNEIAVKTISEMIKVYGCDKTDILCGIGPSICQNCFEVDKPVNDEFLEKLPFSKEYIKANNDKYYIDLWNINNQLLLNAGVPEENIEIGNVCTKCAKDKFYSHREVGFERGSMVAMMSL